MTMYTVSEQNSASLNLAPQGSACNRLQRVCACGQHTPGGGACEACKKKRWLQQPGNSSAPGVPESVYETLASPGHALDPTTRQKMESRFGHDFSDVRVHRDSLAERSAEAIGALAYTSGSHITFGRDQYRPSSSAGQHLLAHELTHVLQQRAASRNPTSSLEIGAVCDRLERQANRTADGVVSSTSPQHMDVSGGNSIPAIQRQTGAGRSTHVQQTDSWSPSLLWITVMDRVSPARGAYTRFESSRLFSESGPIQAPFCQSARIPIDVRFWVDRADRPRPRPFQPPVVSVNIKFTTTTGRELLSVNERDSQPRIGNPNDPLMPRFGRLWQLDAAESGILSMRITMQDVSGVRLAYNDRIEVIVTPCA